MRMLTAAALPVISLINRPMLLAGVKRTSTPISLMSVVRPGQSCNDIRSMLAR
jgi:hypothetical protein